MIPSLKSAAAQKQLYYGAIALALLIWFVHLITLPVRISYDGLGYIDAADVLFSDRFPKDWPATRTPLYPLALKVSFWIFGRQPLAAVLVTAVAGLAGILLLGAIVRKMTGPVTAALAVAALSLFPTLIAFEHSVLTEAATFFFITAILYLLLLEARTHREAWWKTTGLVLALAAGFYCRANVLVLAPVAALLYLPSRWNKVEGWRGRSTALAQAALICAAPGVLSLFWSPYTDNSGLRDVTLKQGMLRQALLPPEHPIIRDQLQPYYTGIRESLYNGNFYSGLRWDYMTLLMGHIPARPLGRSVPGFFWDLVREHPDRYCRGLARTVIFFSGVNGAESDNRIGRAEVLTPGSKISAGPEPLRTRIREQFEQPPALSAVMVLLRRIAPLYDLWVIAAHLLLLASLALALWSRDLRLLSLSLVPLAYGASYAVLLVSLDRFVLPVYPIVLAISLITPVLARRTLLNRRNLRLMRSKPLE